MNDNTSYFKNDNLNNYKNDSEKCLKEYIEWANSETEEIDNITKGLNIPVRVIHGIKTKEFLQKNENNINTQIFDIAKYFPMDINKLNNITDENEYLREFNLMFLKKIDTFYKLQISKDKDVEKFNKKITKIGLPYLYFIRNIRNINNYGDENKKNSFFEYRINENCNIRDLIDKILDDYKGGLKKYAFIQPIKIINNDNILPFKIILKDRTINNGIRPKEKSELFLMIDLSEFYCNSTTKNFYSFVNFETLKNTNYYIKEESITKIEPKMDLSEKINYTSHYFNKVIEKYIKKTIYFSSKNDSDFLIKISSSKEEDNKCEEKIQNIDKLYKILLLLKNYHFCRLNSAINPNHIFIKTKMKSYAKDINTFINEEKDNINRLISMINTNMKSYNTNNKTKQNVSEKNDSMINMINNKGKYR